MRIYDGNMQREIVEIHDRAVAGSIIAEVVDHDDSLIDNDGDIVVFEEGDILFVKNILRLYNIPFSWK